MKKFFIALSCIFFILTISFLGMAIYENKNLEKEQEQIDELIENVIIDETTEHPPEDNDVTEDTERTETPEDTTIETNTTQPPTSETKPEKNEEVKPTYSTPSAVNIDKLKDTNSDTQGWVYLENSNINYPFVHSTGNEYLRKSFYGKKSDAGTIYCYDNQNITSVDNLDKNVVLYGHNMNNGTMFHYVDYLRRNTATLKSGYNKYIYIYTENHIYKYEIFSVYKIEKNENFNQVYFKDDADFVSFCNNLYNRSVYKGVKPDFSDKNIITLATCTSGSSKTHRTALHAVLVEVKENKY